MRCAPMKKEELEETMNQCIGTEHYYRTMIPNFYYTDGVKIFCESACAYWFLTLVEAYMLEMPQDTFYAIHLVVSDKKADIVFTDGNKRTYKKVHIPSTDCPDGDWLFFVESNGEDLVLLYHLEH